MAREGNNRPTESQIVHYYLDILRGNLDAVVVKDWSGWSHKEAGHSEQTNFYRTFDIAMIERELIPGEMNDLTITGFEAKGFSKDNKGRLIPPPFGEGLDQALSLLMNGADFSYIIHPEPKRDDDKDDLKVLCDRYCPLIGIIIVSNDLKSHQTIRQAQTNPYSSRDRKRDMLGALATSGHYDKTFGLTLPLWVKKHQY